MAGKDRKKELARQRYERQLQRRAAKRVQARRMKIIVSVVAVVLVAGTGGALAVTLGPSSGKHEVAASESASPTSRPSVSVKPGECAYQPLPEDVAKKGKDVGTPPKKPVRAKYTMTLDTGLGTIKAKLDGKKAACTVNSFKYLASKKFFADSSCHRLTTKKIYVLQCGDPTGTGEGGPTYGFATENRPKSTKIIKGSRTAVYHRGVLAMAHSKLQNSNGSQFFIVYKDSRLPADYTVFGKVTDGLNIVDRVAKAGIKDATRPGDGRPKKKVTIKEMVIKKK